MHDDRVTQALVDMNQLTSDAQGVMAQDQARLPLRMGGLGFSRLSDLSAPSYVGSLAGCFATMSRLVPSLRGIDLAAVDAVEGAQDARGPPMLVEAADALARLRGTWERARREYAAVSDDPVDMRADGLAARQLPSVELPEEESLPRFTAFADADAPANRHAQKHLSGAVHACNWLDWREAARQQSVRDAVRSTEVTSAESGAAFSTLPHVTGIDSHTYRAMVQRRLGVEISALRGVAGSGSSGAKKIVCFACVHFVLRTDSL